MTTNTLAGHAESGSPDVIKRMNQAIRLARLGLYTTDPNPRVGCVIEDHDGRVVGEGWHQRAGEPHAEVHALQQAGSQAKGGTAYVSLEPCCHHGKTPPCTEALISAGIRKVVVAMLDPNPLVAGQGIAQLKQAGIETQVGVLASEARALNPGFIRRMTQARPLVRLKVAMSLDGRTAMASGESQWITGSAARADVHRLRARSSAILTGITTVLHDDPSLTARPTGGQPVQQPLRVVLDSQLRIDSSARILQGEGSVVIFTSRRDPEKCQRLQQLGIDVVTVANADLTIHNKNNQRLPGLDLRQVLAYLQEHYQINELMVEAGATVNGSFIQAGLVDELWIYMAPSLLGSTARPAFQLPLQFMNQKIALNHMEFRQFGQDLRIRARLGEPVV